MAYSIIEQVTQDIDLFLRDNNKFIHIASAGGSIPNRLAENDMDIEAFLAQIQIGTGSYEIEINPNLRELIEIQDDQAYESYIFDFVQLAKLGFYSYDKTKLGDFEDQTFHLVAKPQLNTDAIEISDGDNLIRLNATISEEFEPFNLAEYFQ